MTADELIAEWFTGALVDCTIHDIPAMADLLGMTAADLLALTFEVSRP